MKTSLKILGLAVAAALLMVVAVPAAEAPTAGTKAPDFTLKSQEGKTVSLHDFKGKWVVLYFYPKDFTQGCTIEAHNFQADQPKYDKDERRHRGRQRRYRRFSRQSSAPRRT